MAGAACHARIITGQPEKVNQKYTFFDQSQRPQADQRLGLAPTKNPRERGFLGFHGRPAPGKSGDQVISLVFAGQPFWRQTAAAPGIAGQGVAVFGGDFAGLFGAAFGLATRKYITGSELVLINHRTHLGNRIANFFLAHFGNLILQGFDLREKVFERAHE
jgi:hypothetical protein